MALSLGDKLGHYKIQLMIGKGGMGEVYKAFDTKLERDVAIKVLPAALSGDPDRLARFEREAKVLAQLNHPGIASVYGVEDRALVMELVPGPTLAERIAQGPIPPVEVEEILLQIADAFEYAHERGIIHRDLKPANIKIDPEDKVKILDFGLAKALSDPTASIAGDPTDSPTITMGGTIAGTILGTAAYMAPEQARGKKVDRRADIWAFGVVVWEMLTGERLFKGDDTVQVLSRVLEHPPDLNRVPAKFRKLLARCLDRNVKDRLRDIGEARFLLQEPESGATSPAQAEGLPHKAHTNWFPWAVAGFFLLALMPANILHFRETPPELRPVNTTLLPPENAEFDFTSLALPTISPDGTRVVFGVKAKDSKQQLWLRRLDSPTAQPLPGTEDASFPLWSPDSRWVAFGQGNKLKKIDIQGGPPVPITDLPSQFRGGSWNAQGVILYALNGQFSIQRVAAAGGRPVPATVNSGGDPRSSHRSAFFLPDGRHFLYTNSQDGDMPVRVGSLDEPGKPGKVVAQSHSTVAYAQGHLLYLRENTLMAQPFDVNRLETTGEAMPLAEGIPTYASPSRPAGFSVSSAGLLVYISVVTGGQSRLVWKDRQGRALGNLGESTGQVGDVWLSPDGKRVAANILDRSKNEDVWIYDAARGIPTRFTFDPKRDRGGVWSPDGNTLYFHSDRKGVFEMFRIASNGAGTEELVLEDAVYRRPDSFSPDGKLLLFTQQGAKTAGDLWVLPLTSTQGSGRPEPKVFLQTPFNESGGRFSPDGQWVVYQSNDSGQVQVYAAPFPGPGGKRQISSAGGINPHWRRDGKEIFYVTPDGELMVAEVAARNGTLEVGKVQKLFDGIITTRGMTYDVSADGQKFLVVDDGASSIRPLTLLQNWTAALRK